MRDVWGRKIPKKKSATQIVADAFHGENDGKKWLEEIFETEFCSECGKGAENHDAIPLMGNWFARCKTPPA